MANKQLWIKQWRRCKEHICIDKRPYGGLGGKGFFMPRFLTPDGAFRMKMRRIMRELKDNP